jgi:hypothetical protein
MTTAHETTPIARRAPALQRCGTWHGSSSSCPCHLNRTPSDATDGKVSVPSSVSEVIRAPGRGLNQETRQLMEDRLGYDFGAVHVHDDERAAASARAVNARAYAVGQHVVLDSAALRGPDADTVLAHELVHTVQQGPLTGNRVPEVTSDPDGTDEREARDVSETPERSGAAIDGPRGGPAVQRSPVTVRLRPDVSLQLAVHDDGRLDVAVGLPGLPVVGRPGLGIRRRPNGCFSLLAGSAERPVDASEIPDRLRKLVHRADTGRAQPHSFRVPTCDQLRSLDGTRWRSYDEYHHSQTLGTDAVDLSRTLYAELVARCGSQPAPLRTPQEPSPPSAVPPALALGQGVA